VLVENKPRKQSIFLQPISLSVHVQELGYASGTDNNRDFDRIPDLKVILL
jgi:hypothetical protein